MSSRPRSEPLRRDRPKAGPAAAGSTSFPRLAMPAPSQGATQSERAVRRPPPEPIEPHLRLRFGLGKGQAAVGGTNARADWRSTQAVCPNGRGCTHSAVRSPVRLRPSDCSPDGGRTKVEFRGTHRLSEINQVNVKPICVLPSPPGTQNTCM